MDIGISIVSSRHRPRQRDRSKGFSKPLLPPKHVLRLVELLEKVAPKMYLQSQKAVCRRWRYAGEYSGGKLRINEAFCIKHWGEVASDEGNWLEYGEDEAGEWRQNRSHVCGRSTEAYY